MVVPLPRGIKSRGTVGAGGEAACVFNPPRYPEDSECPAFSIPPTCTSG